jgi:spore maturation protein CgeB
MNIVRTHLLINCPKLPVPLKQELSAHGLTIVDNESRPTPELLTRTLASVVDFGNSVKRPFVARRWRQYMSAHGVPVFSWNRDAPHNNNLAPWRLALFDMLRPLDIYATHSLLDTRWQFADMMLFLPNAAQTNDYNLGGEPDSILRRLRDPVQYKWDVCFFGAMDGHRYKEAKDRHLFLSSLASHLDTLNISHRFVDTTQTHLSLADQVCLVQSSRINLNFGARCDFGGFTPSGLPERCYGIPSCGGFLLTDRRTHTADSFAIGEHIDDFHGLDECIDKIRYYLGNFSHARNMAEACWLHVMQNHTYANRAATVHQAMLDWHTRKHGGLK